MGVGVRKRLMSVDMLMRLGTFSSIVSMLMVLVVNMSMAMNQNVMCVSMRMTLVVQDPNACGHENASNPMLNRWMFP